MSYSGGAEAMSRKRGAEAMDTDMDLDNWCPGQGIPCMPFGEPETVGRRIKTLRTSLLFSELERDMEVEREAAHLALRANRLREERISADFAARFPMRLTDDDDQAELQTCVFEKTATAEVLSSVPVFLAPAAEDLFAKTYSYNDAACRSGPALPAPLTSAGLEAAYHQLPNGACNTLQLCMQCWFTGRLSSVDVVETVRSFSSSSEAIRALFASWPKLDLLRSGHLGEAATDEDMLDLALLAQ